MFSESLFNSTICDTLITYKPHLLTASKFIPRFFLLTIIAQQQQQQLMREIPIRQPNLWFTADSCFLHTISVLAPFWLNYTKQNRYRGKYFFCVRKHIVKNCDGKLHMEWIRSENISIFIHYLPIPIFYSFYAVLTVAVYVCNHFCYCTKVSLSIFVVCWGNWMQTHVHP